MGAKRRTDSPPKNRSATAASGGGGFPVGRPSAGCPAGKGESRPLRRLKCGPLESSAPSRCDRPRTEGEGEMFDVLKRHEIQVLRRAGLKQTQVAELTGVSERSV